MTVEMVQGGQRANTQLQDFCQLWPSHTVSLDAPTPDFNDIKQNEVMVVDLSVPISQAVTKLQDMEEKLGAKNMVVLTTIPASTSSNMITLTMSELENFDSMVALTKLDDATSLQLNFSSLAK